MTLGQYVSILKSKLTPFTNDEASIKVIVFIFIMKSVFKFYSITNFFLIFYLFVWFINLYLQIVNILECAEFSEQGRIERTKFVESVFDTLWEKIWLLLCQSSKVVQEAKVQQKRQHVLELGCYLYQNTQLCSMFLLLLSLGCLDVQISWELFFFLILTFVHYFCEIALFFQLQCYFKFSAAFIVRKDLVHGVSNSFHQLSRLILTLHSTMQEWLLQCYSTNFLYIKR